MRIFFLSIFYLCTAISAIAQDDAPAGSQIISVEQTTKLKAIRDKIGEIKGLDKLYTDRTHANGLPYHTYIISFKALKDAGAPDVRYHEYEKQGHVIDDFAYFTDGFMDWLFAQKRSKPKH